MSDQDTPEPVKHEPGTNEPVTSSSANTPAGRRGVASAGRSRALPWSEVIVTFFAFVLALLVGAVLMVVADPQIAPKWSYFFARPSDALTASWHKVSAAYVALVQGALGGIGPITSTLARSAPLICAGLGIGLAFRAGLFNIGAQGQAIVGAMMAALVGFNFKGLPLLVHLPIAIIAGVAAGAIWGGIAGVLKARAGAHEVITTIMLNYIASGLLGYALTTTLFQRPGRADPIAPVVEWSATMPRIEGTQLHLGFVIALLAGVVVWWLMERTRLGFQIRAVGSNPSASATAGMSVANVTATTMAWSGALAGLAGVQVALGAMSGATPTPLTAGLVGTIGFDAITVALLGRSRPLGIVLAGLLFGAMNTGGLKMQTAAQTPPDLIMVLQALIVLFVGAPMLVRTLVPFLKARKTRRRPTSDIVSPAASQGGLAS